MLQEMSAIPEYAQVAQLMGSQIQPLAQQVLSVFGVQPQTPPQAGGANSEGTFPGQNTAELPQLPNNPNEPRETIDGGGYFA